ncbi:hypothetical protein MLD38_005538 [Melastoma candidum]|nr:hypothetical protein MLD38_005538 [Melastoma candidum]
MNCPGKFADRFSFISGMMTVEEVARCLMMMSNDTTTRVTGCSDCIGGYSWSLSVESDEKPRSSGWYSGSPVSSEDTSFERKRGYKKLDRLKKLSQEKHQNVRRTNSSSSSSNNNNRHECPICFRVFKSGQAMGGHKRSHFLGSVEEVMSSAMIDRGVVPEVHPVIDLNFPAFLEDGEADGEEVLPW